MKRLLRLGALLALIWWFVRRNKRQPISLRDKVVLITGASAGIGAHTAHAFAAEGAHIVLVARRAEKLAEVEAELQRYGVKTLCVPADVGLDEDIERIVQATMDAFGRIDVLVNNAGIVVGGPAEKASLQRIRQLVNVNFYGAMALATRVLPMMKAQKSGHIVNVSSIVSVVIPPGAAYYTASKTGLNGFSESLRRELRGTGVSSSLVLPGWTTTDMTSMYDHDEMRDAGLISPFMRFETPEKVAGAIVDAVRYDHRFIVLGGEQPLFASIPTFLSNFSLDVAWATFVNIPKAIKIIEKVEG